MVQCFKPAMATWPSHDSLIREWHLAPYMTIWILVSQPARRLATSQPLQLAPPAPPAAAPPATYRNTCIQICRRLALPHSGHYAATGNPWGFKMGKLPSLHGNARYQHDHLYPNFPKTAPGEYGNLRLRAGELPRNFLDHHRVSRLGRN